MERSPRSVLARIQQIWRWCRGTRPRHDSGTTADRPTQRDISGEEAPEEADQLSTLALLIEQARAHIDLLSQQNDSHDAKALGYAAAEVAAIGVIVVVGGPRHPVWALPVIAFALSLFCFAQTLKNRQFAIGPNLPEFYQKWGGAKAVDTHRQMLAQLRFAVDFNERLVGPKQRWFRTGLRSLEVGALLTALLALTQAS
jgi:hypothetical protein